MHWMTWRAISGRPYDEAREAVEAIIAKGGDAIIDHPQVGTYTTSLLHSI